jgi:ATP-dependent protease Clp ATPase subunit
MPSQELQRCSFCSRTREEVRAFVAGPAVLICEKCLGEAALALATAEPAATAQDRLESFSTETSRYCSFCGKSPKEAKRLLHRWAGCICDECLRTSLDILVGDGTRQPKVIAF